MVGVNRQTILYIVPDLTIGGTETTLVHLINNLDPTLYDIHICTITTPNPLRAKLHDHIGYHNIGAEKKESIFATIKFIKLVNSISPDILQTFLRYGNIVSPLPTLFNRKMSVITGIRAVPDNLSAPKDYVERVGLVSSDCVVSNSAAGKEHAIQRGVSPDKIEVIPNGRDMSIFERATPAEDIESLRSKSDTKIVGTVGRLIKRKGHHDLLIAWEEISSEYNNAELVIVGGGREREAIEDRASELGISSSVHLLGTRRDVPDVLEALDIFVFPSHFEGLPGALIEAMASGLPIVATNVDGNAELIEHGTSGLLVPAKEPTQLADALVTLLSDTDRCERYGNTAHQQAILNYSNEKVVTKFDQLYRQLQ
ncbi:glycosyltransferase [Natronocalculus amylovorans]|uniref:Glycosyltransferase n=1 Tax=Natronocalculus amylovorans TaxID=2917812 RepID=A0AAE3FY65_9EURY|nr:glycosyltransferase [Natronocalculus amylovorans]MCL9817479.1 glycosyltransferase [Natronocalculus amylovorans]